MSSGESKNANPVAVISAPLRLSGRRRQADEAAGGERAADEAEHDVEAVQRRLATEQQGSQHKTSATAASGQQREEEAEAVLVDLQPRRAHVPPGDVAGRHSERRSQDQSTLLIGTWGSRDSNPNRTTLLGLPPGAPPEDRPCGHRRTRWE